MKILIADDDAISRRLLQTSLEKWGHEVVAANDGAQAWHVLQGSDPPKLAIVDWMMPEMDGTEVCRKVRERPETRSTYIILLTARGQRADIVAGLGSGADDYVTKPFDGEELRARVQTGVRIMDLQKALGERVRDLEEALARVRRLHGLLPICSYCKKIRNDRDYWQQVDDYVSEHSEAQFSHGICPDCYAKYVKPELDQLKPSGRKD